MPCINCKYKILKILSISLTLIISTNAHALSCAVSPIANLKGTWIDDIRPFDGKSTYKFVVSYVSPKVETITSCKEKCTTTERCVPGYFTATFTLDNLAAQNSVTNVKLKGVINGAWVSFDHTKTTHNNNGTTSTNLTRYWLQPTGDRNKANFVIWRDPDKKLVEVWKNPLTRAK